MLAAGCGAAGEGVADVAGDYEQQGVGGCLEGRFGFGGVEQAAGDVQGLAEVAVVVAADLARVHDDADPELAARREAGVVAGQELGEDGDHPAEQRGQLGRVDEGEQAVTAVDERVAAIRADTRTEHLIVRDARPARIIDIDIRADSQEGLTNPIFNFRW